MRKEGGRDDSFIERAEADWRSWQEALRTADRLHTKWAVSQLAFDLEDSVVCDAAMIEIDKSCSPDVHNQTLAEIWKYTSAAFAEAAEVEAFFADNRCNVYSPEDKPAETAAEAIDGSKEIACRMIENGCAEDLEELVKYTIAGYVRNMIHAYARKQCLLGITGISHSTYNEMFGEAWDCIRSRMADYRHRKEVAEKSRKYAVPDKGSDSADRHVH